MNMKAIFKYNDYERDRFIAEVARSLADGTRVLDAGAGPCRHRPLFAHCRYKAQDFAKYSGAEHSYGDLDYIGDITQIDAPDGAFDFILCSEVFEHIPRPDLAVTEFARLLRPGGELVVTAPLGSGIHMPPYHFYGGFSPFWYRRFLTEAGFTIESLRANGGYFKLYGQESQRFLTMLTPRKTLARLAFMPLKLILAGWFRLAMPIICHFLDPLDREQNFTAGYFVRARKVGRVA